MDDEWKERKIQQRAARDRQLDNIEQALNRATDLIKDSQREIQRSRDLMQDRRDQDRRDELLHRGGLGENSHPSLRLLPSLTIV